MFIEKGLSISINCIYVCICCWSYSS